VPQVTIIAARHAWLTHAFVLLGDNLRQTRTTRRGVPLLTPSLLIPASTSVAQALLPVPQVNIIAARRAWLTHAFVLLGDNLRQTRTTRRGVPLPTPALLIPASTSVAQAFLPVPQVTIIAARHARLTHAFVLLGDNLRQTRTTRRTPSNARATNPRRPECGAEEPARQCDRRCDRR
jgi:hypothetical protein